MLRAARLLGAAWEPGDPAGGERAESSQVDAGRVLDDLHAFDSSISFNHFRRDARVALSGVGATSDSDIDLIC